jgi:hypothetical protein
MSSLPFPKKFRLYLWNGWQQAQLDAPSPGSGDQEIPETEGEILKVDPAVAIMVQVSEYDVTVGLAKMKEINVIVKRK